MSILSRQYPGVRLRSRGGIVQRGQRGFQLAELLIALGILGMIGVAFLGGLSSGSKSGKIMDDQIQAEALARTQIETIKGSAFMPCDPTPCYATITGVPSQYLVAVGVQSIDTPTCLADSNCNTLQNVTVTVSNSGGGDPILAVSAYKVNR